MSVTERTEVLTDQKSIMDRAVSIFSNAKIVDVITEEISMPNSSQTEESRKIVNAYLDVKKRGGTLRVLSKIDEKNADYCKELLKNFEIRHMEDVRGNFAVTEREYISSPTTSAFQPGAMSTVIYSNAKLLVEQNRHFFESLWSRAQLASERIMELEEGRAHRETRIIRGEEEAIKYISPFLSRASSSKPDPYAYESFDLQSTARLSVGPYYEISRHLLGQNPGFRIRHITDIQRENVEDVKRLLKIGCDLRHIDGNKIRFSVSKHEYIETIHSKTPGVTADEIVWSNDPQLVGQATRMFEALWKSASLADFRIKEIEEGVAQPKLQILRDTQRIQRLFLDLIEQAKGEILLIFPTTNSFHREEKIGVIDNLMEAASKRGVKIRIVSPNSLVQDALETFSTKVEAETGKRIVEHRRILEAKTPFTVTILVVDRNVSLVIEQKDDSQLEFGKAIDVATYSTRNSTVTASVRFFERMWEDVELREKEQYLLEKEIRSRRTAELLQDILSHDIRNYNQISITSAELIKDSLRSNASNLSSATALINSMMKENNESSELYETAKKLRGELSANLKVLNDVDGFIDMLIRAVDGSSNLIDRAKRLGKIISQEQIKLYPIDLESSIRKSIELVIAAHPKRRINPSFSVKLGAQVLADEMLEEVFTNVLSNSVNYTERDQIPVEIEVEAATIEGKPEKFWKISFIDQGKGIPDDKKDTIFARYLKTSSGTGLGLSIAYALVVDRYSGKLRIANRVEGDHTKGTRMELWLPKVT